MEIKIGSIVRPAGDGEDYLGRIVKNTSARFRVLDVYHDGGEAKADVVVVRPGGMHKNPGGRLIGMPLGALVAAVGVTDRPAAKRVRTVREHVADDAAFEASYAAHLAYLSRA